jgi:hypothetical protein
MEDVHPIKKVMFLDGILQTLRYQGYVWNMLWYEWKDTDLNSEVLRVDISDFCTLPIGLYSP